MANYVGIDYYSHINHWKILSLKFKPKYNSFLKYFCSSKELVHPKSGKIFYYKEFFNTIFSVGEYINDEYIEIYVKDFDELYKKYENNS